MGARPEPVPQVVQTPSSSVSALLGEVHDISQVIEKIRCERQLQEAQGKQVADKPFDIFDDLFRFRWCLCGKLRHIDSEMMELGGSEMDVKLQIASCKCVCRLLFLLRELYLRLGRAYTEDGQFNRALKAVELASLTRGGTLPYLWDFSLEEKLQERKDLRDPKAAEFAWRMRRLTPPPKEAFLPKGDIDIQAWILAGDAYFEAQRTFDDSDVVVPHQEGEERMMSQEVEQEVHRVVTSCECFFFSSWMHLEDYHLPRIVENKWEKNHSAAAECYSNALPLSDKYALDSEDSESECTEEEDSESECTEEEDSESECTEYVVSQNECSELTKIAYRKLGFVWHECGRRLAELGWHAKDETDKYFRKAIDALHKGTDLPNFESALCSRIEHHRKLAEFCETRQGPKGRIESIEEARARVKYQEALDLCSEAKDRLKEWGDGLLCKEVDTEEAHTHLKLGMFLMKVDPNRNGQISAKSKDAIHEAMNLYNKLDREHWEVTNSQYQLDCIQRERLFFESVKSDVTVDTEEADTYLKLGIMLMREDKFHYDKQEEPNRKGRISAEEAIHEAIDLYKNCQQGVAYSQYRLGRVLRDRMLFESVKGEVVRLEKKLNDSWLKASKYYLDVGDPDMYLRIRMEHVTSLNFASRGTSLECATWTVANQIRLP